MLRKNEICMAAEGLCGAFHKGNVFKGCEQFKNSLKIQA